MQPQQLTSNLPQRENAEKRRPLLGAVARGLTVFRVAAIAPFVWALTMASAESGGAAACLVVLYVAVILSDAFDGRLARAAGTSSAGWGIADISADVAFNVASLGAAAWLGDVGFWVPLGVAALGGRFLARVGAVTSSAPEDALRYDHAGNLAGACFYLLVGVIVSRRALGAPPAAVCSALSNLVFLYTLWLLAPARFPGGKRSA